MKFAQAKKQYLEDLELRRRAVKGVTTYRTWLNRFEKWLEAQGYTDATVTEAFNSDLLLKYRRSLNHLANKTIWGAFHPLRELGRVLAESGAIAHNTARSVPLPDKESTPRQHTSDAEVSALILAVDRVRSPRDAALMRLILYTLIYCGLRAAELVGLRLSYLREDTETLMVLGKGGKWRELSPPSEWWVALHEWMRARREMGCTHDWILAENRGRRISAEGMRDHLEDLKSLGDLRDRDHIKPHALRHWFARNMHRNGATIPEISVALGHTRPMTTFVYLGLDKGDTKAMRQFARFEPHAVRSDEYAERAVVRAAGSRSTVPPEEPPRPTAGRFRRQSLA